MNFEEAKELLGPLRPGAINKQILDKYLNAMGGKVTNVSDADREYMKSVSQWVNEFQDLSGMPRMIVGFVMAALENGSIANAPRLIEMVLTTGIGLGWLVGREQAQTEQLESLLGKDAA